jgi:hypothetical protein
LGFFLARKNGKDLPFLWNRNEATGALPEPNRLSGRDEGLVRPPERIPVLATFLLPEECRNIAVVADFLSSNLMGLDRQDFLEIILLTILEKISPP